MTNESVERETLEILAEKITRYANEADEKTLEAAKMIREARKRVEAGEAGDVTWEAWAREHIKLCDSCPSQNLNPGPDHADLVPSRGRG